MANEKKITVTKKLSMREFLTIIWMFEHPEEYAKGQRPDLDELFEEELEKIEKRTFRFTEKQKEVFDSYIDAYVAVRSFDEWIIKIKSKREIC